MTAAGDVVELVAEVAVADVLGPECEGELQEEADGGEEEDEQKRAASREESEGGQQREAVGHLNLLRSLSNRLNGESAVDST